MGKGYSGMGMCSAWTKAGPLLDLRNYAESMTTVVINQGRCTKEKGSGHRCRRAVMGRMEMASSYDDPSGNDRR
jgi:hypothetical protein